MVSSKTPYGRKQTHPYLHLGEDLCGCIHNFLEIARIVGSTALGSSENELQNYKTKRGIQYKEQLSWKVK